MIEIAQRPKKRLFIALLLLSLLFASALVYGVWRLSFLGLADISESLPLILGAVLGAMFLLIFIGILGLIFAVWGLPTLAFFQKRTWTAVNLLFPVAVMLGKVLDVEKERVERSFIEVSNQLIRNRRIIVSADRLLVMTPHCLQEASCPHKITRNSKNCKRCGRCTVGALAEMADRYGFHLAIATGGTLARQVIRELRPRAVLAIACERDLTSGIQDIYPLPVIGVLNERPCGPCYNTRVDIARVEAVVREFLGEERLEKKE